MLLGMSIAESNPKLILFIIQNANIFLGTSDRTIVGRRFDVGPFSFSRFCSSLKISCEISYECFPYLFDTQLLVSILLVLR